MLVTDKNSNLPEGGRGGDAKVAGDGIAIAGNGGRGGSLGCGSGGHGGGAEISNDGVSSGIAIGGDGGDAGRKGRPALGAASSLEKILDNNFLRFVDLTDQYGILWPGRGGDSYTAIVNVNGREYTLNVLLRLIEIWEPNVIDTVDEYELQDHESWWKKAMVLFPDITERSMTHVRECEKGLKLNPYKDE